MLCGWRWWGVKAQDEYTKNSMVCCQYHDHLFFIWALHYRQRCSSSFYLSNAAAHFSYRVCFAIYLHNCDMVLPHTNNTRKSFCFWYCYTWDLVCIIGVFSVVCSCTQIKSVFKIEKGDGRMNMLLISSNWFLRCMWERESLFLCSMMEG